MTPEERKDMLCVLAERILDWDRLPDYGTREYRWATRRDSVPAALPFFTWDETQGICAATKHRYEMPIWNPLESIADAWMLQSALAQRNLNLWIVAYAYDRTYACFKMGRPDDHEYSEGNGEHATQEAICLAAYAVAQAGAA